MLHIMHIRMNEALTPVPDIAALGVYRTVVVEVLNETGPLCCLGCASKTVAQLKSKTADLKVGRLSTLQHGETTAGISHVQPTHATQGM